MRRTSPHPRLPGISHQQTCWASVSFPFPLTSSNAFCSHRTPRRYKTRKDGREDGRRTGAKTHKRTVPCGPRVPDTRSAAQRRTIILSDERWLRSLRAPFTFPRPKQHSVLGRKERRRRQPQTCTWSPRNAPSYIMMQAFVGQPSQPSAAQNGLGRYRAKGGSWTRPDGRCPRLSHVGPAPPVYLDIDRAGRWLSGVACNELSSWAPVGDCDLEMCRYQCVGTDV